MATCKSGQNLKKIFGNYSTHLLSEMSKNTKHMQLEKIIIDHNKAWATSLIRIKGWGEDKQQMGKIEVNDISESNIIKKK